MKATKIDSTVRDLLDEGIVKLDGKLLAGIIPALTRSSTLHGAPINHDIDLDAVRANLIRQPIARREEYIKLLAGSLMYVGVEGEAVMGAIVGGAVRSITTVHRFPRTTAADMVYLTMTGQDVPGRITDDMIDLAVPTLFTDILMGLEQNAPADYFTTIRGGGYRVAVTDADAEGGDVDDRAAALLSRAFAEDVDELEESEVQTLAQRMRKAESEGASVEELEALAESLVSGVKH